MASFSAAAGQHFAAVGRLHPLAESMHSFTATPVWLICTFHDCLLKFYNNNLFRKYTQQATIPAML